MAAVTQRISNYLGGVSKQSDDKMLPGQVRECYNGFPDATYGLTKRPGFKHIVNLGTGNTFDNAKWFYIHRDDDEEYVGCIQGGGIFIWNAITGHNCSVTYGTDAQLYLTGTKTNYKVLTVQDTTIVINNSRTVEAKAAPNFTPNVKGSLVLSATAALADYLITIQGVTVVVAAHSTDFGFDDVLTEKTGHNIKDAVNALITAEQSASNADFNGTWTVSKSGQNSLDITRVVSGTPTSFTLDARGGLRNSDLIAVQDEISSIYNLPIESYDGHVLKIINSDSALDDYYVKYVRENTNDGRGYWKETVAPNVSTGLKDETMPHELVNTGTNAFTFKQVNYSARIAGDELTNSHPSFVGQKITAGFFHNNRLGFLSKDNVSMSQSNDFYNFYFKTAQTIIDSDPIDISCASIRPTALHSVLPTAQGIILFSEKEQFVLFSDNGVLTPSLATIRSLSNYEVNRDIEPVDVGSHINFITKTPGY